LIVEIILKKDVLIKNNADAEYNRKCAHEHGWFVINILGSPGAGKTSLIESLACKLKPGYQIGVIEGDIASNIDAERLEKQGIPVTQINTGGACHLDASSSRAGMELLHMGNGAFIFIENVGNLVCPASFDLGEDLKMLVSSVPEGYDKPYKYVSMFACSDVIVLHKSDLIEADRFDENRYRQGLHAVNMDAPFFKTSSRTGAGLEALAGYLISIASDRITSAGQRGE
jgi:hydrogenase nickel incorporation protein HypB